MVRSSGSTNPPTHLPSPGDAPRTPANGTSLSSRVTSGAGAHRQPFDAVVGRLILFHLADPEGAIRHHVQNVRPGGLFCAIDFDIGSARTEPAVNRWPGRDSTG